MKRQDFIDALNSNDFSTIREIYLKYREDKEFDDFFNSVPTSAPGSLHFNMLLKRTMNLLRVMDQNKMFDVAIAQNIPSAIPEITAKRLEFKKLVSKVKTIDRIEIKKNSKVNYDLLSDEMKILFDQNGEMKSRMTGLHAEMRNLPDAAENDIKRAELLQEIKQLELKIDNNWSIIDAPYNKTDEPEKPVSYLAKDINLLTVDLSTIPVAELNKLIESCKSYLRKKEVKESKKPKIVAKRNLYQDFLKRANVKY